MTRCHLTQLSLHRLTKHGILVKGFVPNRVRSRRSVEWNLAHFARMIHGSGDKAKIHIRFDKRGPNKQYARKSAGCQEEETKTLSPGTDLFHFQNSIFWQDRWIVVARRRHEGGQATLSLLLVRPALRCHQYTAVFRHLIEKRAEQIAESGLSDTQSQLDRHGPH